MKGVPDLCFALPPSLGVTSVKALARELAMILYEAGFTTVVPVSSYENLERSLISGEIHAAWGPPMVCARVEAAGGRVALRAVRCGASVYRSAIVCRSQDDLQIEQMGVSGLRQLRAVWCDPHSMAGYIMPKHYLRAKGVNLDEAFESEEFLGSYKACFEAVLACEADITASYANPKGVGYVEMCGEDAFHIRVLGYSDECSNEGVIVSPAASKTNDVTKRLTDLVANPRHREVLCAVLNVDDVDPPPEGAYTALLNLDPCKHED